MDEKTNRAIVAYRKLAVREFDVEILRDEVRRLASALSSEEFREYMAATIAIDEAIDPVVGDLDRGALSRSTARARLRTLANSAGLDRS